MSLVFIQSSRAFTGLVLVAVFQFACARGSEAVKAGHSLESEASSPTKAQASEALFDKPGADCLRFASRFVWGLAMSHA